jgi:hypothetical protein
MWKPEHKVRQMSPRLTARLAVMIRPNEWHRKIAEKRAEQPENPLYEAADKGQQKARRHDVQMFCRLYLKEQRERETLTEMWRRS